MKPRSRPDRFLLIVALAMVGACGKEKATALDLRLTIGGAIDQVRIDAVTLGGAPVLLANDETFFPTAPRTLKTGDVLTLWFADSADMQSVTVTATGRLCGRDATAQVMTAPQTLSKSATVTATLALTNNGTACMGGDGGAGTGGGAGGASGAGGTGGAAGSVGAGGVSGTGGSGGSTGGASAGTGGTGVAGTAGGAGRGGAGGTTGGVGGIAGAGGAAGRGGTTGTAGTTGAAGRGGTTGTAGRGGTTGTAGRGGTGGVGGTGGARVCATPPAAALAQPLGTQIPTTPTSCGYPSLVPQGLQYVWTGGDVFALVSAAVYGNSANCGRCVELVRTSAAQTRRATVTIVGSCNDPVCVALPNDVRFQLSLTAYNMLAQPVETSLPLAGETLTYSFVACPVPVATDGQPERIRADFMASGGVHSAVLFVGQRFGIASATATVGGNPNTPLMRGNDNYWRLPNNQNFGTGSPVFFLTDVNLANVSTSIVLANFPAFGQTTTQFPTCP